MYTFKRDQDLTNDFDYSTITSTVKAVSADDIVREFFYFMLGCGFHPNTVVRALESVAEEHAIEEKEND